MHARRSEGAPCGRVETSAIRVLRLRLREQWVRSRETSRAFLVAPVGVACAVPVALPLGRDTDSSPPPLALTIGAKHG